MNFKELSKAIAAASLDSNAGMQGLATTQIGTVLSIKTSRTEVTGRTDVKEENPLVIFGAEGKNKEYSITALALPSLRIQHMDFPDLNVVEDLKETKFAIGLTQRNEYAFLKEFIDNIDGDFDAEKMTLTCVGRLNVPATNDPEKPAMTTQSYKGAADFSAAMRSMPATGDNSARFADARLSLHESGLKNGMETRTPATDPTYFVWVPIWKVAMKAA